MASETLVSRAVQMTSGECCPPPSCWEDIGIFVRDDSSRLVGRRGSPGHIFRHLDLNQFEAFESLVPEGFREEPRSYDWWARTYVWDPAKSRLVPITPPHPEAVGELFFFSNENGAREFAMYIQPALEGGGIEDGVARVSVLRIPRNCYVHREDDHRDYSQSWQLPSAAWYQELAFSLDRPERV